MNRSDGIQEWTPVELDRCESGCEVIDVRGPDEFVGPLAHIENSKLVTLGPDLDQFLLKSKEQLQNSLIVFVCRSGVRSMRAAEQARALGYTRLVNLKGGMIAWNEAKLPIVKSESAR